MNSKQNILTGLLAMLVLLPAQLSATSLFNEEDYTPIASDRIAHKVGDSITVLIYEKAQAGADAHLGTDKSTDFTVGVTDRTAPERLGVSLASGYDGGGGVTRGGNLLASITARVIEIDANGELKIEGNQEIELNEDKQVIKLVGFVRKEDIEADNTVVSSRLSNASISYVAEGTLADRQSPGWLTRFFHWIF